ncbi:MAG: hypothetical protein JSV35_01755, partial [Candidatus Bathyarchaeota archaeon]
DDVSDTGKSLCLVKSHLLDESVTELRIAALYYKPWSILEPDYYVKKTRRWIIFPWERKEAFRKIVEKTKQEGRSLEEMKRILVDSGFNQKLIDTFATEGFRDYPSG